MELAKEQPGPPPREAPSLKKAGAGTRFLLLFGGIWSAVGTFVLLTFLGVGGAPWNDWILDREAKTATGTVKAVNATSSRLNRKRVYEIVYTFPTPSGAVVDGRIGTTNDALLAEARQGNVPLAIEFDPTQPTRNRVQGTSVSLFGPLVLLPLFFAVVGLSLVGIALFDLRRRKQIYIHGEVATATVERVEATAMRQNRQHGKRVFYRFSTGSGEQTSSFTTFTPPAVGTTIWVIYDREDPTRNLPA